MSEIQIEPFDKHKHQRTGFRCGQPSLDEFLASLVTQYEKRKLGKTFVAVRTADDAVVGYYTLAASAVAFSQVPAEVTKKLPKHPVPVILLARLAVDHRMQGQGLGEALLTDALARSAELSNALGVFAVEVHAIGDPAVAFYRKYGFSSLLDDVRHMYLPIATIEKAISGKDMEKKPGL